MKAKSMIKREFSLLLVVVILFSCWVFAAPLSRTATAGNYAYRLVINTTDDVDVGDDKDLDLTLWYKKDNGTGNETTTTGTASYKWAESNGSNNYDSWSSVGGFATKVRVHCRYATTGGGVGRKWAVTLTLQVKNTITNSWVSLKSQNFATTGNGWGQTEVDYDMSGWGGTPAATYCRSLAFEKNVTVPTGNNTTTSKITAGDVTDQYGVNWYQNPYIYQTAAVTGYTLNGNTSGSTVTVGSGAMAAASPWKTTYTVGVKANNNNGTVLKNINSTSDNLTATLTATNPKYTVEWYWHTDGNASTTWSGKTTTANVYYNQTPTAPSGATGVTKYYDSAQHHSGGHYNPTAVTNTNYKFYMQYSTNENHKYNYTELASSDANYHVKHKATCSVATCGYSKTENHDYDTTSFSFSQDGTTATATRVCKTNGCKHSQTETANVTSKVKTAATCTEKGWTTYTATSPFSGESNVKDTKDVQDIPALGHNWKTPTFEWSNDCSSCTATRECTRDASHKETKTVTQIDEEEVAASTCTVNGSTKYTAHSPFAGDTAINEKTLDDIPALGHNWNPTVITFATDGKTATATRTCNRDASHKETVAAPVSHVEKTPATCTEKGWTTYTATSPFAGDTATKSEDREDIAALGHDWNPVTFEFAADGKTATATRVCRRDGKHVESAEAIMSHAVKTPATCTEKGWTTYTATSPWGDGATASVDKEDIAAIEHSWGDWEDLGENGHRRVCANDASHIESSATHTYSSYSKDLPEDETILAKLEAVGFNGETQCYRYCTACNNVEIQNHNYTHETTKEPNCTEGGLDTYTCEYCHTSYTKVTDPLGHDRKPESVAPDDNTEGYECFHCTRCGNYWAAVYNEDTKNYDVLNPETNGEKDVANVKGGSTPVPAPYFNYYTTDASKEGFDYNYSYRESSLKLMKDAYVDTENTRQDFRFSGAVTIPEGISYEVNNPNVKDNVITDFGFIYTQDSYSGVYGAAKLTLKNVAKDNHYAKMSVVDNNAGSAFDGSNWSGVTYHKNGNIETLTFNLVISMKAKNWKKQYAARPYITYKYHGVVYTVYDGGASDQSVTYSFGSVYAIAAACISMNKDKTSDVVFNYVKNRIINHRNDFGTDAATDWWRWFNEYETYEGNVNNPNSLYNWYLSELEAL